MRERLKLCVCMCVCVCVCRERKIAIEGLPAKTWREGERRGGESEREKWRERRSREDASSSTCASTAHHVWRREASDRRERERVCDAWREKLRVTDRLACFFALRSLFCFFCFFFQETHIGTHASTLHSLTQQRLFHVQCMPRMFIHVPTDKCSALPLRFK